MSRGRCGAARSSTAEVRSAAAGALSVVYAQVGHTLPEHVWDTLAEALANHASRIDRGSGTCDPVAGRALSQAARDGGRRAPGPSLGGVDQAEGPTWHQALVFAVTGERRPELSRQDAPDLDVVVAALRDRPRGAHPVPADLRGGIGAAQLAAVLTELRRRLAVSGPRPVLAERTPDADERRLLADVPPHHGA